MAEHTVEKVGGSSMARAEEALDNVFIGDREGDALYNRVFVVSAYGGFTNQLLEHKKTGEPGVYALFAGAETDWAWGDALSKVGDAMRDINAEIFGESAERKTADAFVRERIEGVRSCLIDLQRLCSYGQFRLDEHLLTVREMLAALGEAHSAHNTALLLRERQVNATFVDLTGWRDERALTLDERIRDAFSEIDLESELPIVTGYAQCRDGLMKSFDRGYSEVTFSRIATLTDAREAIIHKEYHLSSADPRVVGDDKVRTIGRTNYDVADQLANMGMEAIHPKAAKGLRQNNIPLRVKNTFQPEDAGTTIERDYVSAEPRAEIITGLASVYALEFFEQDMVGVKGYDAAILDALKRHSVRIVTKASNANTITHYLEGAPKAMRRVIADLEERYPSAAINARKVAIVSAIGSDLDLPGLLGDAVEALNQAGVRVLGAHRLLRRVDVQFIVEEGDYDRAIKALHEALVERVDAPSVGDVETERRGEPARAAA